jgi:hypothetical protein
MAPGPIAIKQTAEKNYSAKWDFLLGKVNLLVTPGVPQEGSIWPHPQILRPDWKGFPRTNALTYSASLSATKEKSFITLTPGFLLFLPVFLHGLTHLIHSTFDRIQILLKVEI